MSFKDRLDTFKELVLEQKAVLESLRKKQIESRKGIAEKMGISYNFLKDIPPEDEHKHWWKIEEKMPRLKAYSCDCGLTAYRCGNEKKIILGKPIEINSITHMGYNCSVCENTIAWEETVVKFK